jgi:hypothetical protein
MPFSGQGQGPPQRKEDRDALGYGNKRVATNGPPALIPFAHTKEGREELRLQRIQAQLDRQAQFTSDAGRVRGRDRGRGRGRGGEMRAGPSDRGSDRGRGRATGRGGDRGGYRGRGAFMSRGGGAPSSPPAQPAFGYSPPEQEHRQGEAGPSNWRMHRCVVQYLFLECAEASLISLESQGSISPCDPCQGETTV